MVPALKEGGHLRHKSTAVNTQGRVGKGGEAAQRAHHVGSERSSVLIHQPRRDEPQHDFVKRGVRWRADQDAGLGTGVLADAARDGAAEQTEGVGGVGDLGGDDVFPAAVVLRLKHSQKFNNDLFGILAVLLHTRVHTS